MPPSPFNWLRSRFRSVDAAEILRTEEARLQRLIRRLPIEPRAKVQGELARALTSDALRIDTPKGQLLFAVFGETSGFRAKGLLTKQTATIAWIDGFAPGQRVLGHRREHRVVHALCRAPARHPRGRLRAGGRELFHSRGQLRAECLWRTSRLPADWCWCGEERRAARRLTVRARALLQFSTQRPAASQQPAGDTGRVDRRADP